jgi:hypothetical protein
MLERAGSVHDAGWQTSDNYSERMATSGSTHVALSAGRQVASTAVNVTIAGFEESPRIFVESGYDEETGTDIALYEPVGSV